MTLEGHTEQEMLQRTAGDLENAKNADDRGVGAARRNAAGVNASGSSRGREAAPSRKKKGQGRRHQLGTRGAKSSP